MFAEIDAELEESLYPKLRQLSGMTDASTKQMTNLCNYIYWARVSDIELKFELDDEEFALCQIADQAESYVKYDAHPELTLLPTYEMLSFIHDLARVQTGQMDLDQSTTFMKYYSLTN